MTDKVGKGNSGFVRVKPITGGQVVLCHICGKRFTKTFLASDTNYAEALRLAVAYSSMHSRSDEHRAARSAFRSPPPSPVSAAEEALLAEIFGLPARPDRGRRRAAVAAAREAAKRKAK